MRVKRQPVLAVVLLFALLLALTAGASVFAQDDPQPAELLNDEGGAVRIVGEVEYTVGFLPDFGAGAVTVVLSDVNAVIDRNFEPDNVIAIEDQILGHVTSDALTSPFSYVVNLPIVPPADPRDVDQDGEEDAGVVVMDISVYVNMSDTAYWEQLIEYGAGLSSVRGSTEYERRFDIVGGKLVVWAPDDEQGFPAGYGEDGVLFTEDDPIVLLPAGYTVVDLDAEPFAFDRAVEPAVDLIEQEQSLQPADYTDLSYTEAFDALIEQMRNEYAFTELKGIDWDALYEEFAPRFAEAEENEDPVAYQFALRDFTWAIPDGHVGASLALTNDAFFAETDGGLGIAIRELSTGEVIVNFVLDDSPAAEAGIELGAQILEINGTPIEDALDATVPWSSPFSVEHTRRLQQLRYVVRFPVDSEVELTYQNPGDDEATTVSLTAVAERASWSFSSVNNGAAGPDALPVEFRMLDSGYGYLRINTFSTEPILLVRLVERAVDYLNANGVPGLVLDMRWNSGGYNLDLILAGYFFDEEVVVGNTAQFYPDLGDFEIDPFAEERITPSPDGRYYGGQIALLTGPACASACEFFSYNMSLSDNVTVVGFYPSEGLGGNITPVFMPDDVYLQFTIGRALNADGDIRLEGLGVQLDVQVPVTEDTLFYEGDVVLDTAVGVLDEQLSAEIVDGGEVVVGEPVEGSIEPGVRVQYTFTVPENGVYNILVNDTEGSGQLDTVLRIYDTDGNLLAENDDFVPGEIFTSGFEEVELPEGLTLVLEVGGFDDAVSGDFVLEVSTAGE